MIDIDKLIAEAMHNKDDIRRNTYRLIKSKFLEFKTAKNAKPFDEAAETTILRKMKNELEEDIKIYESNKPSLAKEYSDQLTVVKELLPPEVSEELVILTVEQYIDMNGSYSQKEMGKVIKDIKALLPTADGKTVATVVKSHIV